MDRRDDLQQRFHYQLRRVSATVNQTNQAQNEFDRLTFDEQEVYLSAMEAQES